MVKLTECPPSKRIKVVDGIGQQVKGSGSMPSRDVLTEHKREHLSKNARRKAARYGNAAPTVGQAVGTSLARKACRERYENRLAKDFELFR